MRSYVQLICCDLNMFGVLQGSIVIECLFLRSPCLGNARTFGMLSLWHGPQVTEGTQYVLCNLSYGSHEVVISEASPLFLSQFPCSLCAAFSAPAAPSSTIDSLYLSKPESRIFSLPNCEPNKTLLLTRRFLLNFIIVITAKSS